MRSRKVTLGDVAERAGVSTTTASYILNGRSTEMRISADAERRVRQAVADLSYRPNRNARSLRTSTTRTIGVITDYVASGMFATRMLSGANAAARAAEHLLVIGETEGDAAMEELLVEEMLERQVDGVLYVTRTTIRTRVPSRLNDGRVVMLNCVDPAHSVTAVLPDERTGGRQAAEALLTAGVDSGVYVVGEDPLPSSIAGPERLAGVQETFAGRGVEVSGVISCLWAVEPAYEAVSRWLGHGHRPAGLVCLNDRIAMGTYQALREHGLVVPDDVSVVSFDGSELAGWLSPHVTSVALPYEAMGELAVRLLLDLEPGVGQTHLVPMRVLAGRSITSRAQVAQQ